MDKVEITFEQIDADKYENLRQSMWDEYLGSELMVVKGVHFVYCRDGAAMVDHLIQDRIVDPTVDSYVIQPGLH